MTTDELFEAARKMVYKVLKTSVRPEPILLAAILIELREMRAKIENRDLEG